MVADVIGTGLVPGDCDKKSKFLEVGSKVYKHRVWDDQNDGESRFPLFGIRTKVKKTELLLAALRFHAQLFPHKDESIEKQQRQHVDCVAVGHWCVDIVSFSVGSQNIPQRAPYDGSSSD